MLLAYSNVITDCLEETFLSHTLKKYYSKDELKKQFIQNSGWVLHLILDFITVKDWQSHFNIQNLKILTCKAGF